jgi:hypothetical protein
MMSWIQCDAVTGRVKRSGPTKRDARPNTIDYEVAALPAYVAGDVLTYDGSVFSVDSTARIAAAKAALEPELLTAHARWQSAVTLGLDCEAHCRAMYENLRAEYDAL